MSYEKRIEDKLTQQLGSAKVGYLLGAGASFLGGQGYPLAGQLWGIIADKVPRPVRDDIQAKLDGGADGIEHALDLIDDGAAVEKPHRHLVTEAIAQSFISMRPSTDYHQQFVKRLSRRREVNVPVFCLNYDGLIERAADELAVRVVDGFVGIDRPFFEPQTFHEIHGLRYRGQHKPQVAWKMGSIHLYKLHGSLGWFHFGGTDVRRLSLDTLTPPGAKRLMVPPQHRKAIDTTAPPFSALWSDFRGRLCHGPNLLHRLVTVGYGMRDEHVNAVIDNALAREDFTLIILAHSLNPEVFARWSRRTNVIIVTQSRCSLNGETGPGHLNRWSFEELSERV